MTENKRFIIDDAGTLIDMQTRNTYDYVSDVCPLLNALNDENEQLKSEIKEWKDKYYQAEETVINEYSSNISKDMEELHKEVYGE